MDTIELTTREQIELIDITHEVKEVVKGLDSGICLVFTPHTTTGILINENESGLKSDILDLLNELVPIQKGYKHDKIDNNARAHLKALLIGTGATIPIEKGNPVLGTWQSIFFVELDGPRTRRVSVKIIEG